MRTTPFAAPGASTLRSEAGTPFSESDTLPAVTARRPGMPSWKTFSGNPESRASRRVGAFDWPSAPAGPPSTTRAAPAIAAAVVSVRVSPGRRLTASSSPGGAAPVVEDRDPLSEHALGRSMPRLRNFSWNTGRRPVGRSAPTIVRSGATDWISNSKMSWSWMTSDSMRSTSTTWVTRREPSSSRSMCTSRSSAAEMCWRIARSGRSKPAIMTMVSMRWRRVTRGVRMHRGHRAVVARVHRLEHVERLGAADLADDDAIGAHAERVPQEIPDRHGALTLDVRRPRLEAEDMALVPSAARRRPRS